MKKIFKAAMAAALTLGMAACGSSAAETTEKAVFQIADDAQYEEFIVVYYTSERKALTGMDDEVHFYKEAGYTIDSFSQDSVKQVYPDFDTYTFASFDLNEDDNNVNFIVHFKDLDKRENAEKAAEAGLIELQGDSKTWVYVDATGIIEDLRSNYTEIPADQIDSLGLHFQ